MTTFWAGQGLAVGPGPDGRWHYRRSLASRVILLTMLTVGLAVALVAVTAYVTTRIQMQHSLDNSLLERADYAAQSQIVFESNIPPWALGAADVRIAYLSAEGEGQVLDNGPDIELGLPELAVARGQSESSIRTIRIEGDRYRVATVPTRQEGYALVIAQSLDDQDRILRRLGWVTIAFGGVGARGVALAAGTSKYDRGPPMTTESGWP